MIKKNIRYQNLWDANEAVLTVEFIAVNIILENKRFKIKVSTLRS